MVNDPYLFGQIAAANALSDIYAMGARPKLAMNLRAYPACAGRCSPFLFDGRSNAMGAYHRGSKRKTGHADSGGAAKTPSPELIPYRDWFR